MTSIRIVGVEKRFGELLALADINLEIGKGEFFTFCAPSQAFIGRTGAIFT
jgi:ABC-type Fe3+/spermidine/putrescine transport system ATPase subunit